MRYIWIFLFQCKFESLINYINDYEKIIILTAPTKTFNIAGMKIANIIVGDSIVGSRFKHRIKYNGMKTPNNIAINITMACYENGEQWLKEVKNRIEYNYFFLKKELCSFKKILKIYRGQGTYFVWIKYLEKYNNDFSDILLKKGKIRLERGCNFGEKYGNYARLTLACSNEMLKEGIKRIKQVMEETKMIYDDFREYAPGVYILEHEDAEIWVAQNLEQKNVSYFYGGTRTVSYKYDDKKMFEKINYLEKYESGIKNILINKVVNDDVFMSLKNELPIEFIGSFVGGGRCVIRPKSKQIENVLLDPKNENHSKLVDSIFKVLGNFLNTKSGKLKLTPDFGRFAGLADMLHSYTENVLGIACEQGGCGGKASYTSTGIIQAAKSLGVEKDKNIPITLIGSAGACGEGVLKYFLDEGYTNICICDIWYESSEGEMEKKRLEELGIKCLKAEYGKFTDECLSRGGYIIATTVGNELINSNVKIIKEDTKFLLAHNEAIPIGEKGIEFIDSIIKDKNILIIPGQMLTFGGALTSRIEWFWRKNRKGDFFNKALAHKAVSIATDYWTNMILTSDDNNIYRKMYNEYIV